MKLTWDEAKRATNLAKHLVDFADADFFDWGRALVVEDVRRNYGEARFVALGPLGMTLYSLAFTRRGQEIRIISLRKASRKERKSYEQKTSHA